MINMMKTHILPINLKNSRIFVLLNQKTSFVTTPNNFTNEIPSTSIHHDVIGPPHPISNLRPIIRHKSTSETRLQYTLRTLQEETEKWNQSFWEKHNKTFVEQRQKYIDQNLTMSETKSTLTADEMSDFYKEFLDKNWEQHFKYNFEWYRRNFRILFLSIGCNIEKVFRRT